GGAQQVETLVENAEREIALQALRLRLKRQQVVDLQAVDDFNGRAAPLQRQRQVVTDEPRAANQRNPAAGQIGTHDSPLATRVTTRAMYSTSSADRCGATGSASVPSLIDSAPLNRAGS